MTEAESSSQINSDSIITREQCIKVLNEKLQTSDFQLLNYKLEPISETKNGFLGTHLRLKCIISFDGQKNKVETFFIKSKPLTNDHFENILVEFDMYRKETAVYQLSKNSNIKEKWCPEFYSFFNNRSIVLEDLAASNFQLAKTMFNFDYHHCQVGLKALAAFHAFSMKLDFNLKSSPDGRDKTLLDIYPDLLNGLPYEEVDDCIKWLATSGDALLYMFKKLVNLKLPWNEMENKLKFRLGSLASKMRPSTQYYNVILHGDVWGNNMLFKYDGDKPIDCRLVDFQVARYSPPVMDVQVFLTINTTIKFQEENVKALSDYYYQQLTEEVALRYGRDLNVILNKTQYESSWKEYIIYSKIMAVHYKGMFLMNNFLNYIDNPEFMFGNRVEYLREVLDIDIQFKNKMTEILEDFQNTLLETKLDKTH